MNRAPLLVLSLLLAACAHLPARTSPSELTRGELWREAHMALYLEDFARADSLFTRLAADFPTSVEGREAVFYLGSMYLDPRNPAWSSERAETALRGYLLQDTVGTSIHRRPEATTLLELAKQLNLPPGERVVGLQPEAPPATPPRVVARAGDQRELQEEVERLRRQLAERDQQIRRQREELERIRRTLAPRTP